MTQEDRIFKTIIDASIKSVVRRYPYILSGEFMGTYQAKTSYLGTDSFVRKIAPDDPNPVTGVRILFTLDTQQVLEWDEKSFVHGIMKIGRVGFSFRYLTTFTTKNDEPELYEELNEADNDIPYTFYRNKYELDPDNKLGYIDFLVRYKLSDQERYDDTDEFNDDDYPIPPRKFIFYKNYPQE